MSMWIFVIPTKILRYIYTLYMCMIHDTSCGMFRLFCGMDCCIDHIPYSILYGTLRVTTCFFLRWTTFVISEQHSTSCQVDVGCKKLIFGEDGGKNICKLTSTWSRALWPHHKWAVKKQAVKKHLAGWLHWRVIIYYCTTICIYIYTYTYVSLYGSMGLVSKNLHVVDFGWDQCRWIYRSSHGFVMGNNILFVLTAPQDRNGGGWGQAMRDNRGVLQPIVITLR